MPFTVKRRVNDERKQIIDITDENGNVRSVELDDFLQYALFKIINAVSESQLPAIYCELSIGQQGEAIKIAIDPAADSLQDEIALIEKYNNKRYVTKTRSNGDFKLDALKKDLEIQKLYKQNSERGALSDKTAAQLLSDPEVKFILLTKREDFQRYLSEYMAAEALPAPRAANVETAAQASSTSHTKKTSQLSWTVTTPSSATYTESDLSSKSTSSNSSQRSRLDKVKVYTSDYFVHRMVDQGFFKHVGFDVSGDVSFIKTRRLSKLDVQGVNFLGDFNVSDCNLSGAKFSKSNVKKLENDTIAPNSRVGRESSFGSFTFNHRTEFSGFLAKTQKESIKKMFDMTQGAIAYSFKVNPAEIKGHKLAVRDHKIILKKDLQNSQTCLFVTVSDGEVPFLLDRFLNEFKVEYEKVKNSKNFLSNFFKGKDMLAQLDKLRTPEEKVRYLIAHIHAEPDSRTAQAMRTVLDKLESTARNTLDAKAQEELNKERERVMLFSSFSSLNSGAVDNVVSGGSTPLVDASSALSSPYVEQLLQNEKKLIAQTRDEAEAKASRISATVLKSTSTMADFPPKRALLLAEQEEKARKDLEKAAIAFQEDMKRQQEIALLMLEQKNARARLESEMQTEFGGLRDKANVAIEEIKRAKAQADREARQKQNDREDLSWRFKSVLEPLAKEVDRLQLDEFKTHFNGQVATIGLSDGRGTTLFGKRSAMKFASDAEFLQYASKKAESVASAYWWWQRDKIKVDLIETQKNEFEVLKGLYLKLNAIFNLPASSEDVTKETYDKVKRQFANLLSVVNNTLNAFNDTNDFKESLDGLAKVIQKAHDEWERRTNFFVQSLERRAAPSSPSSSTPSITLRM